MTTKYILIDPEVLASGREDYYISKDFDLTSVDSEVKTYDTFDEAMEQITYYREEYDMDIEIRGRSV
jgi:hypothetical protein